MEITGRVTGAVGMVVHYLSAVGS